MKKELKFIGIDVSKKTLDICVYHNDCASYVIANTTKSILKFFKKELNDVSFLNYICIENTGKYSWELMKILPNLDCKFYVVNPLHLKRSMGLVRGKNDKIDAVRIAHFIKKNYDEIDEFVSRRDDIETLQILLNEREYRVKVKSQLEIKNKELDVLRDSKIVRKIRTKNNSLIKQTKKQITEIEGLIKELIKADSRLSKIDKQLKSVPGVGQIISWNMLVKTNEFKTIKTPRKMACYSGVAPFKNTSGTSVFGKNRVSLFADKSMKKLLHLGAMSAIRLENDLSVYYHRKVSEGKNKLSVLNAVRNKIIHIIFALVKNESLFENRLVMS